MKIISGTALAIFLFLSVACSKGENSSAVQLVLQRKLDALSRMSPGDLRLKEDVKLPSGADLKQVDALVVASAIGDSQAVQLLLNSGADLETTDREGRSPLRFAVGFGKKETALLLIRSGARVNTRSITGSTPLHIAAQNMNVDLAKLLLEARADVNAETSVKATPLHSALALPSHQLSKENNEIAKAFNSVIGGSPAAFSESEREQMVKLLLANGANSNAVMEGGITPLHMAVFIRSSTAIRLLLKGGADPKKKMLNRYNARAVASITHYEEGLRLLKSYF